jgi:hypothetical protein
MTFSREHLEAVRCRLWGFMIDTMNLLMNDFCNKNHHIFVEKNEPEKEEEWNSIRRRMIAMVWPLVE